VDPNEQRFCRLILEELNELRRGDRFYLPNPVGVECRAYTPIVGHLNLYQSVRNFAGVLTKVRSIIIHVRAFFPISHITDRFIEASTDYQGPNLPME
jgi:hypothetical protein